MKKSSAFPALTSPGAVHFYFWAALFFLVALTATAKAGPTTPVFRLMEGFKILGLAVPPVYLHFFIFDKTLSRRRYGIYAWLLLALLFGYAALFTLVSSRIFTNSNQFPANAVFLIFFLAVSTALKASSDAARQKTLLQEIRAKQVQTELGLLKAQIHPHFLFNTLNNLFVLARKGDPATADGIARLSHLMRYIIEDGGAERVGLDREIEQIRRLIELEKLRFSPQDRIEIGFDVRGEPSSVRIPPMILLPFIENAFKHGVRAGASSYIRIRLDAGGGRVRFSVRNGLPPRDKDEGESGKGLGLKNVRRRLELLYPGAHSLSAGESDGEYRVEMALDTWEGGDDEMPGPG